MVTALKKPNLFAPSPPCNSCRHMQRCANEGLVCPAFIAYCDVGRAGKATRMVPHKTMAKWLQQCTAAEPQGGVG